MANLLQVQINIVLSILLTILLGHAYFKMNKKEITNRLFIWIMGLTWFVLILEIFSVLLNNPKLKQFLVLNKLVNVIGFIVTPIIPFLGYIIIKEWVNRYQRVKIKLNKILFLPLFINVVGILLSYNWGWLFYITSENSYERGPLFFVLPCVSYIYFVYSLYFIYKHRKKLTFSEFIIFSLFYIIAALFTGIQLKYFVYLTTWSSTAIIIVATYIFILNDQAYRDSLTGLENRLAYVHYTQNIDYKKLKKLSMIYIDMDELKAINDQYGHGEGDEAIKSFSNLLVESFPLRKKKLIRLGGDEFLIILEEQHQEKIIEYINNLIEHVEEYNNRSEKSYRLRFSYGMASYKKDNVSVDELLQHVDQLMYEQKQRRKSKIMKID